jgi:hypothetical protein
MGMFGISVAPTPSSDCAGIVGEIVGDEYVGEMQTKQTRQAKPLRGAAFTMEHETGFEPSLALKK